MGALLKPDEDPEWDEDFAKEIGEYHPYFSDASAIHPIATDNPYIVIFRHRAAIYAYYMEMEGIYYLGKNEEDAERNYDVIRFRGWDYSVFPLIDDKGQVLKDAWCMGNYNPNWELPHIEYNDEEDGRFPEERMKFLIYELESQLAIENRKELDPLRIMDLVALHTWIDRDGPKWKDVEASVEYCKLARELMTAASVFVIKKN